MNNDDVRNWYANRVPLSGTLSDYALLVGQNNRALQRRVQRAPGTNPLTLPPNPNRISVSCVVEVANSSAAVEAVFLRALDAGGNIIAGFTVYAKAGDIALVTPSPPVYSPVLLNVRDYADLVQGSWATTNSSGQVVVTLIETTFVPKCCEYIGQVQQGSQEPQLQEYFADKQARRRNP